MRLQLITLFIVFLGFNTIAQEPKVVVFNQSEQTEPTITARNLFKLGLLEPLFGDISLYFEHVIGQNTSAEIGAGVTIDDYAGNLLFEEDYAFYSNTTPLIGGSFALGFRYYPFVAGDEFYFAPEFKYRYYHNQEVLNEGTINVETLHHSHSMANFRITVGYNLFFDDKIFMDFYGGVGIAMFKLNTFQSVYNDVTMDYEYVPFNKTIPRPWLSIGIKLGFGVE